MVSAQKQRHYARNRESILRKRREHYEMNRERVLCACAAYVAKHPDATKARLRGWHQLQQLNALWFDAQRLLVGIAR